MIVHFIDDNWSIIQRLVRIDACSKSVNADELAQVLNQCLSVDYGVETNSLLAAMRDGASVNQAALDRISFIFPKMLNVVCFSHTLDNVGNHLVIPTLLEFGSVWIRLFRHSYKAKLLWKNLTGQRPRSYRETRWWSKWEGYQQILMQFGDIERFLIEAEAAEVGPQLLPQLHAILSDPARLINLKLKLVKATYFLEGGGLLVLSCYEKLSAVARACQAPHFPNMHAVAAAIAEENPAQSVAALEQQAKARVQSAIEWFLRKFNVQLVQQIFPFLNDDGIISGLKAELPAYLAATEDVVINTEDRKVEWWHNHKDQLPHWASAVKKALLVQPSSAAAERVFSILNSSFNDQQEHTLVDYLQASVMTQYNKQ